MKFLAYLYLKLSLLLLISPFVMAIEFDKQHVETEIMQLLNHHFASDCEDECYGYKHKITLHKELNDKRRLVLSLSTEPSCFSFGCSGRLSVFDFQIVSNKWQLISADIDLMAPGHSGDGADEIEIKEVSDGKYVIMAYDNFMHQGVEGRYVVMAMKVNNNFKNVVNIMLDKDVDSSMNPGLNYDSDRDAYLDKRFHAYTSTFTFKKNKGKEFPMIVVNRKGRYEDSLELLRLSIQHIYIFNGSEYQSKDN